MVGFTARLVRAVANAGRRDDRAASLCWNARCCSRRGMIIVVMGVAGAGKTTIGTLLAERLGCTYLDADALHPQANIEAMRRGLALSDADRAPWLAAIRARIVAAWEAGRSLVVGCSALKASYRAQLSHGVPVTWVYLHGPAELIRSRLRERTDHFFAPQLLDSQLAALEAPQGAIAVDVSLPPAAIVARIVAELGCAVRTRPEEEC